MSLLVYDGTVCCIRILPVVRLRANWVSALGTIARVRAHRKRLRGEARRAAKPQPRRAQLPAPSAPCNLTTFRIFKPVLGYEPCAVSNELRALRGETPTTRYLAHFPITDSVFTV